MIAAVLCGGKGTRLRDVIGEHQKCCTVIGDKPWLHRVLDFLAVGGIAEVVLLTGYKAEEVSQAAREWVESNEHSQMQVLVSLPTIGGPEAAMASAFESTRAKTLLFINGDTILEGFDLQGFLADRKSNLCVTVRGPSVLSPKIVDSGIYYRFRGCGTPGS